MKSILDFRLYLITDRHRTGDRPLIDVVKAALDGGVRAIQLREKDLSSLELCRLATEMRQLTSQYSAKLIINDRIDIANAVEADGIHLGINGIPIRTAHQLLGNDKIIAYSAHAIDEALQAEADGADFVTFSPVYHTPSKSSFGPPCGITKLQEAVMKLKIPVIALGGINIENLTATLSTKVAGIALISAIIAAPDPRSASVSLLKKIEEYVQYP